MGLSTKTPWAQEPECWGGAEIAYISQFTLNPQKRNKSCTWQQ